MTKSRILIVTVVVALVVSWLLSGILTKTPIETPSSIAEAKEALDETIAARDPMSVRGRRSTASEQFELIVLYGRIVDRNQSTVPALTRGQIVKRHVDIGDKVKTGDVLCELDILDRDAQVEAARDAVDVLEKEFESTLTLIEDGFDQRLNSARKKSQLSAAQQRLLAAELELQHTKIKAPIDGIVDQVHVNVGDYIETGNPCATILVLDPVYVQAYVSEEHVHQLNLGQEAEILLPNGATRKGTLSFVSRRGDLSTRTFRIEIELPNEDYAISSGLSATINLPTTPHMAHKIPASVMAMNEQGRLGIKTVDSDNVVAFHEIDIVREDSDGVWVSGLPSVTTIITVGQGLVVAGERVSVELRD